MSRMLRSLPRVVAVRPTIATPASFVSVIGRRHGSHSAAPQDASADVFPEEGFNAPFWTKLALAGLSLAVFLRVAPSPSTSPSSSDAPAPYITRYIQHNLTPSPSLWKSNQEKHLELAVAVADEKLLVQEAERPKVRRLRYLGSFDQASPNSIPVGSQADLTDLIIKSEKDDFAKEE